MGLLILILIKKNQHMMSYAIDLKTLLNLPSQKSFCFICLTKSFFYCLKNFEFLWEFENSIKILYVSVVVSGQLKLSRIDFVVVVIVDDEDAVVVVLLLKQLSRFLSITVFRIRTHFAQVLGSYSLFAFCKMLSCVYLSYCWF